MDKEYVFNEGDLPRLLAKDLKYYSRHFVEHYWGFVGKLASRHMRNDEDAEDLRQQVFESVLRALERKSAEDIEGIKFPEYLRMATKNCSINMSRGERKHQLVESLDTLEELILQETLVDEKRERRPDTALEDKEFHRQIRELLSTLPSQQRVAVMLRHGWRLSYPDIARAMQVSEKNAKHLVRYGHKKLKQIASAPEHVR